MQLFGRLLQWLLGAGMAVTGATNADALGQDRLLAEIERLREEVQRMKVQQSMGGDPQLAAHTVQQQPPLHRAAQPEPARWRGVHQPAAYAPSAAPEVGAVQQELLNIRNSLGQISGRHSLVADAGLPVGQGIGGSQGRGRDQPPLWLGEQQRQPPDGCTGNPLFATLHGALQKLALLEQDPVEASYQIHAAWEEDPKLFDVCPAGLVTALVYLAMAQEQDWKYRLLHRATFFLFSTPGLANKMSTGRWPMSDRLIRTMYHNSEVRDRTAVKLGGQPPDLGWAARAMDPGIDEAVGLALQHRDSVTVHFRSVLFYHFYHSDKSPCACRTRSWCLPQWVRYVTNHTVDIWLAGRDEAKTLHRMDRSGCFHSLGHGLASHYFAEPFDLVFVFEINAFMHPQCRILPARRMLLYPTFELSDSQMQNFEAIGVSVLPDDAILKPPNARMRHLLEEASTSRQKRAPRPKDRLLLFPADIRPMKGQSDFLQGLLIAGARTETSIQRLKRLTVLIAGACDGNQTYCAEVVSLSERVNAEGHINVVLADQLKDEELAQLYAAALGVVLHSRVDCNPRSVYEGLVADSPFFVTERTRLPPLVQHLGHIGTGEAGRLAEHLADFVDFCEAGGFAGRPQAFAQRHLIEADIYRDIVRWMEDKYTSGQVIEGVIRSEEALSGPLGGLGAVLGGVAGLGGAAAGLGGGAAGLGGGVAGLGGIAGLGGAATGFGASAGEAIPPNARGGSFGRI